jgi:hypothetical protein
MALTDSEILDLQVSTLSELGRLKFNQIATRIQNYEVMGRIMKKDKVSFDSGKSITRQVMVDHSGAAKNVGLYQTDAVNVADVMKNLSIPWRHTTTNYAFDRREIAMNRPGPQRIVELLKVRRADAMISLAELMEDNFWSKPATSSDELQIFGVPYWIVSNATTGFNGGAPTGFTAGAGGLLHDRWKNYTGTYVNVTKADLVAKMRTAFRKIRFKSPVDIPDYRKGNGDQYRIYVNEDSIKAMETVGEEQNENLGRDLAPYDGSITFKRNPIVWVPELDSDTADPIYMINFAYFCPVFLRGEYLREGEPRITGGQHTVFQTHIDLTWNILCTDRRCQAVLTK